MPLSRTASAVHLWIDNAPESLKSAGLLARECGVCKGEFLALQRDCVTLFDNPDEYGTWGRLNIRRGLKRDARKRVLSITSPMREVLVRLLERSKCKYVFVPKESRSARL